ncbi:nucleoside-triphosphatase THEP1 isoform X2 [Coccinella septempunctata]|uniref:nucleoside-triphosphatase THEP1 isoform X2 n=1 Tax=Coccinella septempunctata TaxID=41139 RepID=UPI001D097991|nr:nucleoside-triphosphatase THEP1 isoform X2 [Coccinella septempunctata]
MLICLTGLPGSGKTTLIKKLVEYLKQNDVGVEGFFTEEIRDPQGYRVGFDIVTLKDERAVFARKRGIQSSYKVGTYFVDIAQFEKLVLPLLYNPGKIMIIDEIGKMELFSEHFKNCITNLVQNSDITIVATVPLKGNDRFIKDFKEKAMKIVNVG